MFRGGRRTLVQAASFGASVLFALILPGCAFGLADNTVDGPLGGASDGRDASAPDVNEDPVDTGDALPPTEVALTGKLYGIPPASIEVVEPPGLDALFDNVLTRNVLVYVAGETTETLRLDIALAGPDGLQDPCETVRSFPDGDWTQNPTFDVGPGQLDVSFAGHPAAFRNVQLHGVFDESGSAWNEGTLSAMLDTRELAPALGGIEDVCALVDSLGGTCVACEDGADACFKLSLANVAATLLDADFSPSASSASCAN